MHPVLIFILIIAAWGMLSLILIGLTKLRARILRYEPVPREQAPSKTCRSCRLPFRKASWRCGRCGAYMKPRLFYWIARGILEPLLYAITVPWILGGGLVLSAAMRIAGRYAPAALPYFEGTANRLGVWLSPEFQEWVPEQWRVPEQGTTVVPKEVDAPIDVVIASVLTLGVCLLKSQDHQAEVYIPEPDEETLDQLRHTPDGIHEIWGYVSDGHLLAPDFHDQIIGARIRSQNPLEYVEGLTHHLSEALNTVRIRPVPSRSDSSEEGVETVEDWRFLLRGEPELKGDYPLRWEVHATSERLLQMEELVADLDSWDQLPCSLLFR